MNTNHRYFIRLTYNGKSYHGWQWQVNAVTVQQVLEEALGTIFGVNIGLTGAGRTDTGVHAKEFYAHFDLEETLDGDTLKQQIFRLNGYLPEDIHVFEVFPVAPDAHARFSAISRTYEYLISRRKDPFLSGLSWYLHGTLDLRKMNEGASLLLNYHDFTSFSKLHTQVKTNHCDVMEARWEEKDHLLLFTIRADRFLRNMVRAIVGTLVDVGKHKIDIEDLQKIIEAMDRSKAGLSAPAHGLYLSSVEYPEELRRV